MICKRCKKEFNNIKTTESTPYDRGDGVIYGTPGGWVLNDVCPHCGYDNSPCVYMENS